MSDKPAILQSTTFTVQEGIVYRASRTLSIWMNKLFFSSLVLLVVWLTIAAAGGDVGCAESVRVVDENGTVVDQGPATKCSVWLTPTAKYLGAMAVFSFVLSVVFGAVGLVVGKRVLESTPAGQEVGARPLPEGEGSGDRRSPEEEGDVGPSRKVPPGGP
jgi:hypothetical protein